jgi:hypothetical protein
MDYIVGIIGYPFKNKNQPGLEKVIDVSMIMEIRIVFDVGKAPTAGAAATYAGNVPP